MLFKFSTVYLKFVECTHIFIYLESINALLSKEMHSYFTMYSDDPNFIRTELCKFSARVLSTADQFIYGFLVMLLVALCSMECYNHWKECGWNCLLHTL